MKWVTALLLMLYPAASVFAQAAYPDRPVRVVVPFPAGSVTDLVSRMASQKLALRLGQQFLVENRVGASGGIAVEFVAKAAPDGYTMALITASTHGLAPALNPALRYDPIRDFRPVSMIGEAPYVLVITPGIPATTVAELVAFVKTRPGQLNYGSAGNASVGHLAAALLAQKSGMDINHVPYKATAQSVVDLMTGRLDMQIATVAPTVAIIREGKLRALATTGKRRLSVLSDVPTMMESGISDYAVALWMAFAMPAGAPEAAARRINAEMTAILAEPDTVATLRKQGVEPEPGPPAIVTARIREEVEMWRGLIAKAGIKAEE
jgi:tripartite-type tricarboxylate transporter receptor subunit TctC